MPAPLSPDDPAGGGSAGGVLGGESGVGVGRGAGLTGRTAMGVGFLSADPASFVVVEVSVSVAVLEVRVGRVLVGWLAAAGALAGALLGRSVSPRGWVGATGLAAASFLTRTSPEVVPPFLVSST